MSELNLKTTMEQWAKMRELLVSAGMGYTDAEVMAWAGISLSMLLDDLDAALAALAQAEARADAVPVPSHCPAGIDGEPCLPVLREVNGHTRLRCLMCNREM